MPKVNVYLPDDLADAVRQAGLPVSAICQRALEQAVRRITAIRRTTLTDLPDADLAAQLPAFTPRARAVLAAADTPDRTPGIDTVSLLTAMIDEGENLALHVLRAIDVDPGQLRRDLTGQRDPTADDDRRFSVAAASALELTVTEAIALGHNYVGCEHLLLGLVTEPDGAAGQVLRTAGAEARLTRRAVTAALAGYAHLRAQAPAPTPAGDPARLLAAALDERLRPLLARIDGLERRLDSHQP
ncbi:Clp protease N-terminal domain-containing protein [Micromonospora yangpuensis]|uniref:Clp amino terminal domain-containing protein, pathogenicity island component n=1 Tax=Micromonospora yangpuensis TaxID=683228 RepID=A0A1C6UQ40_9ACTN|nr:Clp protease N-terminal domain-containing protein [Micromonospora yangpuensis]GGM07916.1 hypothetical protein GCM10012279_27410 [Micromonospora yangpuensis]SCL56177.1 Clp amino terminal domain-containing protein, pathogenicity island component [Micromonospora yangpuensis]